MIKTPDVEGVRPHVIPGKEYGTNLEKEVEESSVRTEDTEKFAVENEDVEAEVTPATKSKEQMLKELGEEHIGKYFADLLISNGLESKYRHVLETSYMLFETSPKTIAKCMKKNGKHAGRLALIPRYFPALKAKKVKEVNFSPGLEILCDALNVDEPSLGERSEIRSEWKGGAYIWEFEEYKTIERFTKDHKELTNLSNVRLDGLVYSEKVLSEVNLPAIAMTMESKYRPLMAGIIDHLARNNCKMSCYSAKDIAKMEIPTNVIAEVKKEFDIEMDIKSFNKAFNDAKNAFVKTYKWAGYKKL